jgi:hypothetical protein
VSKELVCLRPGDFLPRLPYSLNQSLLGFGAYGIAKCQKDLGGKFFDYGHHKNLPAADNPQIPFADSYSFGTLETENTTTALSTIKIAETAMAIP